MKRICSILLAFCLCAAALTGCGKAADPPAESANSAVSSQSSSSAAKAVTKTNDFDEATNQQEEFHGASYQIPASWTKVDDEDTMVVYNPKPGSTLLVGLTENTGEPVFESDATAKSFVETLQSAQGKVEDSEQKLVKVGKYSAVRASCLITSEEDGEKKQVDYLFVDAPAGTLGFILTTPESINFSFESDFEKIVASLEISEAAASTTGDTVDIVKKGTTIGTFTVNSVTTTDKRNKFADENPAQVVIIDYTYENTASDDELYLFSSYFQVIDAEGNVCTTHPLTGLANPQKTPVGAKSTAQVAYNLTAESSAITFILKPNMFDNEDSIKFELPVS